MIQIMIMAERPPVVVAAVVLHSVKFIRTKAIMFLLLPHGLQFDSEQPKKKKYPTRKRKERMLTRR